MFLDLPDIEDDVDDSNNVIMPTEEATNFVQAKRDDNTDEYDAPPNRMVAAQGEEELASEKYLDSRLTAASRAAAIFIYEEAAETVGIEEVAVENTEKRRKDEEPVLKRPKRIYRPNACAEAETETTLKKRRWSSFELDKLFETFGHQITRKEMPSGKEIHNFAKLIAYSRSVPQIRTQLNNIISGKVKCHNLH